MAGFRTEKIRLSTLLEKDDWYACIREEVRDASAAVRMLNPLLAFLHRPEKRDRAAWALGEAAAVVAKENMESIRVLVRRLMWSLNEESGNLGWGAPEALGCILAAVPVLAKEYGGLLLSYAHDTGREDNYLDYAPLRAGVLRGAARLAETAPDIVAGRLAGPIACLRDTDPQVRGMAVLAVLNMLRHGEPTSPEQRKRLTAPLRERAATAEDVVSYFDGRIERTDAVSALATEALDLLTGSRSERQKDTRHTRVEQKIALFAGKNDVKEPSSGRGRPGS